MKRLMVCGFAFDSPMTAGIELGLTVPGIVTEDGSTIPDGYTHEPSIPDTYAGAAGFVVGIVVVRPYAYADVVSVPVG